MFNSNSGPSAATGSERTGREGGTGRKRLGYTMIIITIMVNTKDLHY